MALTSKSPRRVVLTALATAQRSLPAYSHRYSPKKFTQHQLFACLVLKNFLKTDYRGVAEHLADNTTLLSLMNLRGAPLYHVAQSLRSPSQVAEGAAASGKHHSPILRTPATSEILGHRLHRSGVQQRESVFRAPPKPSELPVENGRLPSLSQAGLGVRHELSFHPLAAGGPRTTSRRR